MRHGIVQMSCEPVKLYHTLAFLEQHLRPGWSGRNRCIWIHKCRSMLLWHVTLVSLDQLMDEQVILNRAGNQSTFPNDMNEIKNNNG